MKKDQNPEQRKPDYIKPKIEVSFTKEELKEQFTELQGQSPGSGGGEGFVVDLHSAYEDPQKKIYASLGKKRKYKG